MTGRRRINMTPVTHTLNLFNLYHLAIRYGLCRLIVEINKFSTKTYARVIVLSKLNNWMHYKKYNRFN